MKGSNKATNSCDVGGLVVDFPRQCSHSSASCDIRDKDTTKAALMPKSKPERSVHFSDMSQLVLVEYPTQGELRRRWYSKQEQDCLKLKLREDIHLMARKLATTAMGNIGQEDLIECIGLEGVMKPEIAVVVNQRKRDHVRSILAAQDVRQYSRNSIDEDELSRLSERISQWTRKRAQELAAGYWDLFLLER